MKKLLIIVLVLICFPACEIILSDIGPCNIDISEDVCTIIELDISTGQTRQIIDEWIEYPLKIIGIYESKLYLTNEYNHKTVVDLTNKKLSKNWNTTPALVPGNSVYLDKYNKVLLPNGSSLYSYDFITREYDSLTSLKSQNIVDRSVVKISQEEIGFASRLYLDTLAKVVKDRIYTYNILSNKIELFADIASFDFDISQDKSTIIWMDPKEKLNLWKNGINIELFKGSDPILIDNDRKFIFSDFTNYKPRINSSIYNLELERIELLNFRHTYQEFLINKLNEKIFRHTRNILLVTDIESSFSDTLLNINDLKITTERAVTSETLSVQSIQMSEDETKLYVVVVASLYWDGCGDYKPVIRQI